VDKDDTLRGLITIKDIEKKIKIPQCLQRQAWTLACRRRGRRGDYSERVPELLKAGVDIIVVDTAHGHSQGVLDALKGIKKRYPELDVVAGNIATAEAAKALIRAGADCVKVGIGPGSICTTRVVSGAGVPQITAIMDCCKEADKAGIPVNRRRSIKFSGDIYQGFGSRRFVGHDRRSLLPARKRARRERAVPGQEVTRCTAAWGSIGAMERAARTVTSRPMKKRSPNSCPRALRGVFPIRGPFRQACINSSRSAFRYGYCGAESLKALKEQAQFIRITVAGLRESHVHDVVITKESSELQDGFNNKHQITDKHEAPSSKASTINKHQITNKLQISNTKDQTKAGTNHYVSNVWTLDFGNWSLFGFRI